MPLVAKLVLEEEVKEACSLRNTLHDEEDALSIEVLKLQDTLNEKDEIGQSLQLKCEDLEQESQRMKFENQLQQLMGQHKNLCNVFTPERLPLEVQSAEYTTQQLLKAENQMLEQVAHLQEELSKAQASDSATLMHDESFTHILHT
ncbi:synaptonemal complex central element protein 1-like [Salminus brasiliensis]|uniref:synaptonemal complex central element protein 1-like n=1 Tax=Salminus brasiliensis TaxID=930266 RepID=UPI003B83575E